MTPIGRGRQGIAGSSFDLLLGALLVAALLLPLGCSFSASSQSSSESSASSSASSSPASREEQYRSDVRDYTASYVKSGGRMEDFRKRLGELAKERDITNWEENMVTYEGTGRGLGKAKASPVELQTYTQNLAGADPKKAEAMKKGYEAEKQ
jgi:hypothetical protein